MTKYRVLFADGTEEKVHADDRDQAENIAVYKRNDGGLAGSAVEVVNVLKDRD